jgi:hypothetical protein
MTILRDTLATLIFEREKLDKAIAALQKLETGEAPGIRESKSIPQIRSGETPRKRKFSAASRKKMAAAQKARWARVKEPASPIGEIPVVGKKRQMSAAGRKRIIAATKARWARAKAEGRNNLKVTGKKGKAAGAGG